MALYRPCLFLFEARCSLPRIQPDLARINTKKFPLFRRCDKRFERGFREKRTKHNELAPPAELPPNSDLPLSMKTLIKPLFFTVGFTASTVTACTVWEYERYRRTVANRSKGSSWNIYGWLPQEKKTADWRQKCNDFWNSLSEGQKLFAPVLFANVAVFAAWRIPAFQKTMLVYFASNPAARVLCWPMLLSTFSHYSVLHLAANMFVLHSFSHTYVATLGKEQATALYLSAGVISSFTSFLHKVVIKTPGLSVGASGAIMAILGYFCTEYPDSQLSLIFLPFFTFSAGTAIKVAVGVDLAGCIMGWRLFDHAAHLGGALTGILWAYYGRTHLWPLREHILRPWNDFRGPIQG